MSRSIPLGRAALVACTALALVGSASAQTAMVHSLAGACGSPLPVINSTIPVVTQDFTIFITSDFPNAPILLIVSEQPAVGTDLGNGCIQWVTTGPNVFSFTGTTNAQGAFSITAPPLSIFPFFGATCNGQAFIAGTGAGSVMFAGQQGYLSNGIAMTMGNPPGGSDNQIPPGGYCTYKRCDWCNSCTASGILNGHFGQVFPNYLEVGVYDTSTSSNVSTCSSNSSGTNCNTGTNSGSYANCWHLSQGHWHWNGTPSTCGSSWNNNWWGNTNTGWYCSSGHVAWGGCGGSGHGSNAGCSSSGNTTTCGGGNYNNTCGIPNGKRFTNSWTGRNTLCDYLCGCSSTDGGAFTCDSINSSSSNGGGNLGREVAALTLNVKMNDAGFLGFATLFGDLVYVNPGDALHAFTVRQILAAANQALAGNGFPAGYTGSTFEDLFENLNKSWTNCTQNTWAGKFLYSKAPVI